VEKGWFAEEGALVFGGGGKPPLFDMYARKK
jgi:hypothetical protein